MSKKARSIWRGCRGPRGRARKRGAARRGRRPRRRPGRGRARSAKDEASTVTTCSAAEMTTAPRCRSAPGSNGGRARGRSLVLQAVEHVESGDPGEDRDHQREDRRLGRGAHGDPRAAGRERERETEHEVRGPGKALGRGVTEQDDEHRGREQQRPAPERRRGRRRPRTSRW